MAMRAPSSHSLDSRFKQDFWPAAVRQTLLCAAFRETFSIDWTRLIVATSCKHFSSTGSSPYLAQSFRLVGWTCAMLAVASFKASDLASWSSWTMVTTFCRVQEKKSVLKFQTPTDFRDTTFTKKPSSQMRDLGWMPGGECAKEKGSVYHLQATGPQDPPS